MKNFPMHADNKSGRPNYDDVIAAYLTFFAVLFKTIRDELTKMRSQPTAESLATAWRKHLEQGEKTLIRQSVYAQVTTVRSISV
jgi:hypothetical protein